VDLQDGLYGLEMKINRGKYLRQVSHLSLSPICTQEAVSALRENRLIRNVGPCPSSKGTSIGGSHVLRLTFVHQSYLPCGKVYLFEALLCLKLLLFLTYPAPEYIAPLRGPPLPDVVDASVIRARARRLQIHGLQGPALQPAAVDP